MCICFPIGLIAIFVALKSKRAWRDDRPESGGDLADMAKTLALIGILCSIIVICMIIALVASGYFYRFLHYLGVIDEGTMQRLLTAQGEEQVHIKEEGDDYITVVDYEVVPDTGDDTETPDLPATGDE